MVHGGSILGSAPAAFKKDAQFKKGVKTGSKISNSLC